MKPFGKSQPSFYLFDTPGYEPDDHGPYWKVKTTDQHADLLRKTEDEPALRGMIFIRTVLLRSSGQMDNSLLRPCDDGSKTLIRYVDALCATIVKDFWTNPS